LLFIWQALASGPTWSILKLGRLLLFNLLLTWVLRW